MHFPISKGEVESEKEMKQGKKSINDELKINFNLAP
jgi:hypothetical protein